MLDSMRIYVGLSVSSGSEQNAKCKAYVHAFSFIPFARLYYFKKERFIMKTRSGQKKMENDQSSHQ